MDGKIIIYLLLALALIGGTSGLFYSNDVDEAQRELDMAQSRLKSTDDFIAVRKTRLAARAEAATLVATADGLAKEQVKIRKETEDLQKRETELLDDTLKAVKTVRLKASGEMMPELVLNTDKTLKNVRIQSVDEDMMVVSHSEGVAKIPAKDLPHELRERFVFGIDEKKPDPIATPDKTADTKVAAKIPAFTPPPPPVLPTPKPPKGNVRIEGDPALWNEVTRRSLGRVFVPGKGWLEVGSKGPIPPPVKSYPN